MTTSIDIYVVAGQRVEIYVDGEKFNGRFASCTLDGELSEVLLDDDVYGPDDVTVTYHPTRRPSTAAEFLRLVAGEDPNGLPVIEVHEHCPNHARHRYNGTPFCVHCGNPNPRYAPPTQQKDTP